MDISEDKPTYKSCRNCGASTALSWVSIGSGSWEGSGRCSSCGWMLCFYLFEGASKLTAFGKTPYAGRLSVKEAWALMGERSRLRTSALVREVNGFG